MGNSKGLELIDVFLPVVGIGGVDGVYPTLLVALESFGRVALKIESVVALCLPSSM